MSDQLSSDPHVPYVQALADAGDWAALVRYWMAHKMYAPALIGAIKIVAARAQPNRPPWRNLSIYLSAVLKAPFDLNRSPLPSDGNGLSETERDTLTLTYIFANASLCEHSNDAFAGTRAQSLGRGIKAAQVGVQLARKLYDPALAACLLNAGGSGLRHVGDLETARNWFEESLAIRRKLAKARPLVYLPFVALTLGNLGDVQRDRKDFAAARTTCEQGLRTYQRLTRVHSQKYMLNVAMTLNNLGNIQLDLHELKVAGNSYIKAIEILRKLESVTSADYSPYVAGLQHNLGIVQRDLHQPEAAQSSFVQALSAYRALASRSQNFLPDVAMTLINLGTVQRAQYFLKESEKSFQEGLTIYRELALDLPQKYLSEEALALGNLGIVQRLLQDLTAAKCTCSHGLSIYRRLERKHAGLYRSEIAQMLNNLGNTQRVRRAFKAARKCFEESLAIYQELAKAHRQVYLPDLAMTLNNLGNVQSDLDDMKEAQSSYEQALRIYQSLARRSREVYLPDVAMMFGNLGSVQQDQNDLNAARGSYKKAARIYKEAAARRPAAHLSQRFAFWSSFGRLYLSDAKKPSLRGIRAARDCFRKARDCAETMRGRFLDPTQRSRVQADAMHVYDALVHVCVDIYESSGNADALREAVEVAEASRARNLMELLAEETLTPERAPLKLVKRFRDLRRRLKQMVRRLEHEESQGAGDGGFGRTGDEGARSAGGRAGTGPSASGSAQSPAHSIGDGLQMLRDEVDRLTQQYQASLTKVRRFDGSFDPDQPVPPIDLAAMRALIPTDVPTAVVHYSLTRDRSVALILTRETLEVVPLPALNNAQAMRYARKWFAGYYKSRRAGSSSKSAKAESPSAAMAQRLPATLGQRRDPDLAGDPLPAPGSDATAQTWPQLLPQLLEPVSQRAVQPVVDALITRKSLKRLGIERLILVPNRALHVFPLHACMLTDGSYLTDAFEVVYAPSLSILHRCASRKRDQRDRLFMVQNPTSDLAFTEAECAAVSGHYPRAAAVTLRGDQATREALLGGATDSHVWHYSGHAVFDPKDPLASGLVLGSKDAAHRQQWLTLRDVFCGLHLRENLLVTISGCESGMLVPDSVDEYVGLPSGFLYAGASCVLSSQWFVADLSTALLIDRFHQEWLGRPVENGQVKQVDPKPIGAALRAAMRWLREIRSGTHLNNEIVTDAFLSRVKEEATREACRRQAQAIARQHPDNSPFTSPFFWAPFVATGLSYSTADRARSVLGRTRTQIRAPE